MTTALIVVYSAAGPLQGNIVKGLLEAAGIPVQLSQEGAGSAYGLTVGPLGLVEVIVPANRADEARAIIKAMERGDLNTNDETA